MNPLKNAFVENLTVGHLQDFKASNILQVK